MNSPDKGLSDAIRRYDANAANVSRRYEAVVCTENSIRIDAVKEFIAQRVDFWVGRLRVDGSLASWNIDRLDFFVGRRLKFEFGSIGHRGSFPEAGGPSTMASMILKFCSETSSEPGEHQAGLQQVNNGEDVELLDFNDWFAVLMEDATETLGGYRLYGLTAADSQGSLAVP